MTATFTKNQNIGKGVGVRGDQFSKSKHKTANNYVSYRKILCSTNNQWGRGSISNSTQKNNPRLRQWGKLDSRERGQIKSQSNNQNSCLDCRFLPAVKTRKREET